MDAVRIGTTTFSPRLAAESLYDYLVGKRSYELTDEDRFAVYVEADGFGDCREGEMRDWLRGYVNDGYDWSHVRDSSNEALLRALNRLTGIVSRKEVLI